MSRFRQILAGLILVFPLFSVQAAPPRFQDMGESQEQIMSTASTPQVPAAPKTPASKDAGKPASGKTGGEAKRAKALDQEALKPASTPIIGKEKHSWLWRLFHRKDPAAPEITTVTPPGDLVNTDKRYKPDYDQLHTADLHQFKLGYDARWHVKSSKVMCRLYQILPSYGYVEFRQGVDQPLEFALYVKEPPAGSGLVRVSAKPPIWRHFIKTKQLGRLELESGKQAVVAGTDWSRRLMLELSEGMQPVLHFWDAADASDDVEVFVSAIGFQRSRGIFNKCLDNLLQYDFKKVKRSVLHFNPDSSRFLKRTYSELGSVLDAIKSDPGISNVNLEVYTVRSGLARYNFRLATRRAQSVRDYLMKHGISEDRIFIKIHTKSRKDMTKLGYSDADVYVVLDRKKPK